MWLKKNADRRNALASLSVSQNKADPEHSCQALWSTNPACWLSLSVPAGYAVYDIRTDKGEGWREKSEREKPNILSLPPHLASSHLTAIHSTSQKPRVSFPLFPAIKSSMVSEAGVLLKQKSTVAPFIPVSGIPIPTFNQPWTENVQIKNSRKIPTKLESVVK